MSNDKTITETLPVEYKGWTIKMNHDLWSRFESFRLRLVRKNDEFESIHYAGSIEEAKELIDERI